MDKKEKQKKRSIIAEVLDLAGARLKDSEVDALFDIVSNPEAYDGKSRTIKNKFTSWCSDGKYTREEETVYTLFSNSDRVHIKKDYSYHDDDGQSGGNTLIVTTAREILGLLNIIIGR